ncbi:hypothetical protein LX32DRAFT_247085 [Colletotrichum zoysiae]|uniref:Uncharacterized protein n=1 Tax=Colletotrichum zoysiae TaxID=1216348 RepID=A0AAD9M7V0_9PEZI|nr:hypothetical protein LX32DRAFT_247085 [Colletotrichum zoysiae]
MPGATPRLAQSASNLVLSSSPSTPPRPGPRPRPGGRARSRTEAHQDFLFCSAFSPLLRTAYVDAQKGHSYSPGVPWFEPGRLGEQGPSNHSLTRATASAYGILEQLRRGASSRRPPVSVRGSYLLPGSHLNLDSRRAQHLPHPRPKTDDQPTQDGVT